MVMKSHTSVEESSDSDLTQTSTPTTRNQPSRTKRILREIFWFAGLIVIVAILHNFVFQAFYVSGSSMEPDFHDSDYLIVSKLPVTYHNLVSTDKNLDIERGQVLVFRSPQNKKVFFIKRVIGLPGDRVVINDGKVTIYNQQHPEGFELHEDYTDPTQNTLGNTDEVVENGKLFVLGDNRSLNGSYDSREWGQLPQGNVSGIAVLKIMPFNQIGPIKQPSY